MLEGVLILRNSSLNLKMVVDNAILRNYAVPSENIFKRIKIKQRTAFTSNEMSVNSAEIKTAPENNRTSDNYLFAFDYAYYRYARQTAIF